MAQAVRAACAEAFDSRATQAGNEGWTFGLAALLAAALFALLAYEVWSLRWWLVLLCEIAAVFVALLLEVLLRAFALRSSGFSQPWPAAVSLYARTAVYVSLGLGSLIAVLTLSQEHNHLSTIAKLAVSSPLGLLAAAIGLWSAIAVAAIRALTRRPADPYPELLLGLLDAVQCLGRPDSWLKVGVVLPGSARCRIAETLEHPAQVMRANAAMRSQVGAGVSPEVAVALERKGARVAAWLGDLQTEILWPQPDGGEAVQQKLAKGLMDACAANWQALEAEPPPAPNNRPARALTMLPRVALTLTLLAAAFLVPDALGSTLSTAARATLTVSLIVAALSALLAPREAVSTFARDIESSADTAELNRLIERLGQHDPASRSPRQ